MSVGYVLSHSSVPPVLRQGGAAQTFEQLMLSLPGLIAYWPLTDTAGTTADNAQGNAALDLTYVNAPLLATTVFPTGDPVVYFAQANDAIDLYHSGFPAAFDPTDGWFQMWIKNPYPNAVAGVPLYAYANANNRIYIDNSYPVMRSGGGNIYYGYNADDPYWHQIVLAWNNAGGYGWFDGVPVTLWTNTKAAWVGALSEILTAIGATQWWGTNSYNGSIGHVAWGAGSGNLPTDAQIAAIYDAVYPARSEIIFCGDSKTAGDIWTMLTKSAVSVATSSLWRIQVPLFAGGLVDWPEWVLHDFRIIEWQNRLARHALGVD